MGKITEEEQSFRDQLSTVSKEGKRNWIYPKKPFGKFYNARTLVSYILLLVLIGTPFIKVKGHPFVLFDVINRNFILFGTPFGPHDFSLIVIAMIAVIVGIFLFTSVYGRIFCGWICPQTIFMEMVFRKIEYFIEGDASSQRKLNEAPWTKVKLFKKTSKQIIFFSISFFIANILLAYIIGTDQLIQIVTDSPSNHVEGLIAIIGFSLVFYWIFSYFREQACTIVCPYGRLQGVMLDQDSLVIAYDYKRGEPRGKIKKNQNQEHLGDCVNCHLCVDVCPTGIDIRNGIQLECVNCTACIDACDNVMEKVNRPKGLIRYASLNGIEKGTKIHFTPRMISYTGILVLLVGLLGYLVSIRTDFSINILRTPGLLYQDQPGNKVSNLYDINIVNKTYENMPINIKLENIKGTIQLIGAKHVIKPLGILDTKFLVTLPKDEIKQMNTPVTIAVYSNNKLMKSIHSSFLGPVKMQKEDNGSHDNHEKESHEKDN